MYPIPDTVRELLTNGENGSFSLFFPRMVSWRYEEQKIKVNKSAIEELYSASSKRMIAAEESIKRKHELQRRILASLLESGTRVYEFKARLSSPFISGLGSGHPTETGMILDRNTGVPYLPASGIKGVLRMAHAIALYERNRTNDEWCKKYLERDTTGKELVIRDFEPSLRKYFGDTNTGKNALRGQLVFLDAFPEKAPSLKLDIMNPHFGGYYEGTTPPVETENPVPVKFIAVKEGTVFIFRCFVSPLPAIEEDEDGIRQWGTPDDEAITNMIERGLMALGMGAKTAIGYGRFEKPENMADELKKAAEQKKTDEAKRKHEEVLSSMTPDEREKNKYETFSQSSGDLVRQSVENSELTKEFFLWLRDFLKSKKEWKTEGNPEKDKTVKRCLVIEKRIVG